MAEPKTVIPVRRRGSHNPGGAKPRRTKDAGALSELDREEREFKERRAAERKNSKPLRVLVRGPVYLSLLKLSETFGREPKIQAELCLELGVRFYENNNTPFGGPRPLENLPEVREGTVIESGDAPLHRAPTKAEPRGAGWMGQDAGLPVASTRVWTSPEEATVAVVPIQEPPPEEEGGAAAPAFTIPPQPQDSGAAAAEAPVEDDIEVTVV